MAPVRHHDEVPPSAAQRNSDSRSEVPARAVSAEAAAEASAEISAEVPGEASGEDTRAASETAADTGKTAGTQSADDVAAMAPVPTQRTAPEPGGADGEAAVAELETLRRLLVAPERTAVADLRHRLDTPEVRTREMAHLLPDAIHLRDGRDTRLGQALQPTVEEALRQSVRRNPKQIVDAIFPVMGPAIRRAIVSTLMGMIQSFNKVIDHTFTLRGIRWRIEALTTGRSFAEVVLLHTLVYQVEQIYLIHGATGLVLEHVVPPDAMAQDPDLISSMLTAIQDFVRDSFATHGEENLNTLRMGADRSIWIEQSSQVSVAAVIRGTPPVELRRQLREILESVQITHAAQLEAFEGDSQSFADLRPRLSNCLQARFHVEERRLAPLTLVLLLLLVGALVAGGLWLLNREQRWQAFIERLGSEKGIVVTRVEKQDGKRHIFGLRDPLATQPEQLLTAAELPDAKVAWHWRAYHDLDPEFVLARIRNRLQPPKSVTLQLTDGRLRIGGFAHHRWIAAARQATAGLTTVTAVDMQSLRDLDLIKAEAEAARLRAKSLYFAVGAFDIDADHAEVLADVVATLKGLTTLSQETGISVELVILGHTDESGTRAKNLTLAQRRAEVVREHLIHRGVPAHHLQAIGVGTRTDTTAAAPLGQLHRSVTFQVRING